MQIKTAGAPPIRPAAGAGASVVGGGPDLWEDAPTEITRRSVIMEVYGDSATGRSTFAFSAPPPIAYLFAAEKTEGIVQRAQLRAQALGSRVRVHNFGAVFTGEDNEAIAAQAKPVLDKLLAAYYDALGWARTIILDTHTEAWELFRIGHFGSFKPEGGRVDSNYGPVNALWRSMFKAAKLKGDVNFIVIGQTKDEWVSRAQAQAMAAQADGAGPVVKFSGSKKRGASDGIGERTGRTVRAGQKEIVPLCDAIVRTYKELGDEGPVFRSVIEKGWYNAEYEGMSLEGQKSNFPHVMSIITETDEEEWTK